jgi:ABC-type sugar transport system ATPase subunit
VVDRRAAGSGRSELLRLLAGVSRPRSGSLHLDGRPYRPRGVSDAQRAGVVLIPQERRAEALMPDSVERNLNTTTIGRHTLARFIVSRRRERAHAQRLWRDLDVRGRSLDQEVLTLSGGNQQKVVLAKFLALRPVLLLDEPTRGVDVATKSQIYTLIRDRAASGCGVLVVSSELPELLGLCDRIVVLHDTGLWGPSPRRRDRGVPASPATDAAADGRGRHRPSPSTSRPEDSPPARMARVSWPLALLAIVAFFGVSTRPRS